MKRGYTLIETIIAIAIFAMIVYLGTMALSQGLRQYKHILSSGIGFWRYAKYVWITKNIGSMVDYYIYSPYGFGPYFIGHDNFMSYITLSPIANDIPSQAIWVVEGKQKYSLVYYEIPVYSKLLKALQEEYETENYKHYPHFIILKNCDSITLMYYGYNLNTHKYNWYKNYNALKQKILPTLIKISYTKNQKTNELFFGVNNNSTYKSNYNFIPGMPHEE